MKKEAANPDRPLPLNRGPVEEFELGYKEPKKVPLGKVTLKSAIQFITNHQMDPKHYNAANIAEQYNLPEDVVSRYLQLA